MFEADSLRTLDVIESVYTHHPADQQEQPELLRLHAAALEFVEAIAIIKVLLGEI